MILKCPFKDFQLPKQRVKMMRHADEPAKGWEKGRAET
jgi:hypothetical protein